MQIIELFAALINSNFLPNTIAVVITHYVSRNLSVISPLMELHCPSRSFRVTFTTHNENWKLYSYFVDLFIKPFQSKTFLTFYLSLLASRSDSSRVKMSPSRTGPLTFLMIWRFCSPKNSTRTWVHCPWDPVRPRILMTRAKVTEAFLSMFVVLQVEFEDMWRNSK